MNPNSQLQHQPAQEPAEQAPQFGGYLPKHGTPDKKGMKKKLIIAVAALLVLLGGLAGVAYATPLGDKIFRSPEDVFYKGVADARLKDQFLKESLAEPVSNTTMQSTGYVTSKGDQRAEMSIACSLESPASGKISTKMDFRIINATYYMKLSEIDAPDLTESQRSIFQGFLNPVTNVWIDLGEADASVKAFRDTGLLVGIGGVLSNDIEGSKIADATKRHKVFTITNSRKEGSGSDRYYVYDVTVKRDAYDTLLEELKPGFPGKKEVLDNIFIDESSRDFSLALRTSDAKMLWATYDIDNACVDFGDGLAIGDTSKLPKKVKIISEEAAESDVKNLEAPTDVITIEEYFSRLRVSFDEEEI